MRLVVAILLATVLASFTDWFFFDVACHRLYRASPDVWRQNKGAGRILLSQVIGTAATAFTIVLCTALPQHPWLAAAAFWIGGPLPVLLQNWQWMRVPAAVTAWHAAGSLARIAIAAACAILPQF